MLQKICMAVLISFFLVIPLSLADTEEDSGCEDAILHLIDQAVPEEEIVSMDMTSMDIRTGNGLVYVIGEEDACYILYIVEIHHAEISSVIATGKALYQDRGTPGFYVETDGEVTVTYPTGEGMTFIKDGEHWILSAYGIAVEEQGFLDIGFSNHQTVEWMRKDRDGAVLFRSQTPYRYDGSLLLEQLDVQTLPKNLSELENSTADTK